VTHIFSQRLSGCSAVNRSFGQPRPGVLGTQRYMYIYVACVGRGVRTSTRSHRDGCCWRLIQRTTVRYVNRSAAAVRQRKALQDYAWLIACTTRTQRPDVGGCSEQASIYGTRRGRRPFIAAPTSERRRLAGIFNELQLLDRYCMLCLLVVIRLVVGLATAR